MGVGIVSLCSTVGAGVGVTCTGVGATGAKVDVTGAFISTAG